MNIKKPSFNKEYHVPLLIALILVCMILFLHIYAFANQNSDHVFVGVLGPYFEDTNTYLSWAKQVETGNILLEYKYYGHTDTRLFFHLQWFVMGLISSVFGISIVTIYHLGLLITPFLLVFSVYHFTKIFFKETIWRYICLVLIFFIGGWGWLAHFHELPFTPSDIYAIEMTIFPALCYEMIIPVAAFLLTLSFTLVIESFASNNKKKVVMAGLTLLSLGMIHPDELLMAYGVIFIFCVHLSLSQKSKTIWKNFLTVFLISVPIIVYDGILLLLEPSFFEYQVALEGWGGYPDFLQIMSGFGFLSILATIGTILIIKKKEQHMYFCLVWMWGVITLSCLPLGQYFISLQNHALVGIPIPVTILSVYTLRYLAVNLKKKHFCYFLLFATFSSGLPTSISYYYRLGIKVVNERTFPYYIPYAYIDGFHWLKKHSKPQEVVLASFVTSNIIPLESGNRVVWGHDPSSRYNWLFKLNLKKGSFKQKIITEFSKDKIRYVFLDKKTGPLKELQEIIIKATGAKIVHSNKLVVILSIPLKPQ